MCHIGWDIQTDVGYFLDWLLAADMGLSEYILSTDNVVEGKEYSIFDGATLCCSIKGNDGKGEDNFCLSISFTIVIC